MSDEKDFGIDDISICPLPFNEHILRCPKRQQPESWHLYDNIKPFRRAFLQGKMCARGDNS